MPVIKWTSEQFITSFGLDVPRDDPHHYELKNQLYDFECWGVYGNIEDVKADLKAEKQTGREVIHITDINWFIVL